jgi:LacI family transcriptional regulator
MKKKSIVDIARHLNTSVTTVSFVINGKAKEMRISKSLEKKISDYVKESGYKPNELAQSFRTGKTKTIGLMLENIADPFFAQIAKHIEDNAYGVGYKIIYCSTDNNTEKAKELIKIFRQRKVDGFIITPPVGIEEDIKSLLKDSYPVILFDRFFENIEANFVGIDNFENSYDATKHLIDNGYKNIALITIVSPQTQMIDRTKGYQKAMAESHIKDCLLEIPFHTSHEDIIEQITLFLKERRDINGVFIATNYLAIRALEAIKNLKLKIPQDIAIIAYDDHDLFRLYTPSITAVAQPVETMSKKLVDILLDQLHKKGAGSTPVKTIVPANLIVRESSVPASD